MTTRTALDLRNSVMVIGRELSITPNDLFALIKSQSEDAHRKLIEAHTVWTLFEQVDTVSRGKMLGITLTKTK